MQEQEVLRREKELEATVVKKAEAERRAAVLVAQGQQEAAILEAEGRKQALIATAPSALGPSQSIGVRNYALPPNAVRAVAVNEASFSVVSTTDLSDQAHVTGPVSKSLAYDAMKTYLAANPEARGTIQILPTHEVQPAGA